MSGPTAEQLRVLLDGVQRLHAARSLPDLREVMIDLVERIVGNDHVCYNEVDLELRHVVSDFNQPGLNDIMDPLLPVFERVMHQHPILHYCIANPTGPAQRLSDYLSKPGLHDLELYQSVYKHVDTEHQVILDIGVPGRSVVAFALNRQTRDYDDRDLAALRLLQPHLRQAYAACRQRDMVDAFLRGEPTELLFDRVMELGLGAREAEVCVWIAQGLNNAEIGERMKISPLTVKKHGENIYRKLGASGRADVTRQIIRALLNGT